MAVLQRGYWMHIFHKVVWFIRVFLKWSQWSCQTTPFLPCQKQLCSQWLILVHISLHANELCSPHLSLLWKWSSLSFNFLIKPALNCPSFRKIICAARHKRIEWSDVWPSMVTHTQNVSPLSCLSCVPTSCFLIWFVSCPCLMSLLVN